LCRSLLTCHSKVECPYAVCWWGVYRYGIYCEFLIYVGLCWHVTANGRQWDVSSYVFSLGCLFHLCRSLFIVMLSLLGVYFVFVGLFSHVTAKWSTLRCRGGVSRCVYDTLSLSRVSFHMCRSLLTSCGKMECPVLPAEWHVVEKGMVFKNGVSYKEWCVNHIHIYNG